MDLAHFNYTYEYSQMLLKLLNNGFKTNKGKIKSKDKQKQFRLYNCFGPNKYL